MFAPGSSGGYGNDDDYKDNPKSGRISFKKEGGRIKIYNGQQAVGGSKFVSQRLNEMSHEVARAQRGFRGAVHTENGYKGFGTQSTFPNFFRDAGFNSKADFAKAVKTKEGVKFHRLAEAAIHDLNTGYRTNHGEVDANRAFQVRSKQVYDNRGGVRFVRINGHVVPIRGHK